jgi:hypothetical protein
LIANAIGEETSLAVTSHGIAIAYVDKASLQALISEAQQWHDGAAEGTLVGQYPVGSKANLLAAISTAIEVINNASASQDDVAQAASTLNAALATFKALIITGTAGDLNHDTKVSIGDLAIVAKHYGATSADADWTSIKLADVNQDGVIDIADLAWIATKILN